jgi:hypothetical protein
MLAPDMAKMKVMSAEHMRGRAMRRRIGSRMRFRELLHRLGIIEGTDCRHQTFKPIVNCRHSLLG